MDQVPSLIRQQNPCPRVQLLEAVVEEGGEGTELIRGGAVKAVRINPLGRDRAVDPTSAPSGFSAAQQEHPDNLLRPNDQLSSCLTRARCRSTNTVSRLAGLVQHLVRRPAV